MHDYKKIYGNVQIIEYMQKIIKVNKVPHAIILDGQAGTGKNLLADTFAKTLQCEEHGENPCGVCTSCKQFENKNQPDIFYIAPTDKKSIGVEDVRAQINNELMIKPYSNAYKIFIIDKSETLTVQAQNALLKNIEEPPSYGVFIFLTTNSNNFLPTILSRCVLLKIKPLSNELIKNYLMNEKNINEDDSETYSTYGKGSIGQAVMLFEDEEFISIQNFVIDMLMNIKKVKPAEIFNIANKFEEFKPKIDVVLDIMYFWYRDLIIYKALGDENFVFDKTNLGLIKKNVLDYSLEKLYNVVEEIKSASSKLKYNSNFRLTMEVLLLNIKE